MKIVRTLFATAALTTLAACTGSKGASEEESATVSVDEGTVIPEPEGAAIDTVSLYEGVWDLEKIRGHLARAGVATTAEGEVRQPFMAPRGTRLRGSRGELQVFVYADAGARARDTDWLDSSALILPADAGAARRQAAVVSANNLAVIVVGPDSALLRSVTEVLRARRD